MSCVSAPPYIFVAQQEDIFQCPLTKLFSLKTFAAYHKYLCNIDSHEFESLFLLFFIFSIVEVWSAVTLTDSTASSELDSGCDYCLCSKTKLILKYELLLYLVAFKDINRKWTNKYLNTLWRFNSDFENIFSYVRLYYFKLKKIIN